MYRASSIIKNQRLEKDLEIGEISKKLKIPVKYLVAIEDEVKCDFPPDPYCSLMVKDYANFLGLNGEQILSLFRRDFDQKRQIKQISKTGFSFTPQFTFTVSIILFIVVFAGYLTFEYIKFNRPPELKVIWPQTITENIEITGTTESEATVRINQDLVIVDSSGKFSKRLSLNNGDNKVVIESKSPSGKTTTQTNVLKLP